MAAQWRKSTKSLHRPEQCVEVRITADRTAVRDTKDRAAGHFTASRHQWSAFVSAIKAGHYDH